MAGKVDTFSSDILNLVLNNLPISELAPSTIGSVGKLYLSLHTQDPTDTPATKQSQYEVNYTGYVRMGVIRSNGSWTVVGKTAALAADVLFGRCTNGIMVATHVGVGTDETGDGKLLYTGALAPTISIQPGVRPIIEAGSTITEE